MERVVLDPKGKITISMLAKLGWRATAIVALLTSPASGVFAQSGADNELYGAESKESGIDAIINSIAEQMDEEGLLDEAAAEGLADLRAKEDAPINLNTATETELSSLIFLDERKARAIMRRRRVAGGIRTAQELMTIKELNATDILILSHIASAAPAADSSTLRQTVKINAIWRAGRRWPLAHGYKSGEEKAAAYYGGALKTMFRVKAEIGGRLGFGLVGDNDSGEPQLKNGSGLMDFYGGYATYEPARGPIRKIVAGHYNVRLGQGLGIWTGLGFAPTMTGTSYGRTAMGVTPSASAAESGYMRGVAAEARILPIRLTAYASFVDADATTKRRADGTTYITTIRTSGYHRTATERSYRHNVTLTTIGAYASADIGRLRMGIGANNWHVSKPLGFNGQEYRRYYPTGKDITTISHDARVFIGRAHIYGEVATQGAGAAGGVAGIDYDMGGGKVFAAAIRRFSKRYFAQMQQPVCRTSRGGSESGLYAAYEAPPLPHLNVRLSIDAWKLRWLQSNAKCPTNGWSARIDAQYDISRRSQLTIKAKVTSREATTNDESETDGWRKVDTRSTSCKAIFTVHPSRHAEMATIAERTDVRPAGGGHEAGLLIAQTMKVKSQSEKVSLCLSGSLFDTDSYAARTYTRRPMVLYDMAFAACYGRGASATAMVTLAFAKCMKVWLWCTHTKYADRDVIGSGYEQTAGPRRTDVKIQLQWKLWWKKQPELWPAKS